MGESLPHGFLKLFSWEPIYSASVHNDNHDEKAMSKVFTHLKMHVSIRAFPLSYRSNNIRYIYRIIYRLENPGTVLDKMQTQTFRAWN